MTTKHEATSRGAHQRITAWRKREDIIENKLSLR
jgi:hypothetical protein